MADPVLLKTQSVCGLRRKVPFYASIYQVGKSLQSVCSVGRFPSLSTWFYNSVAHDKIDPTLCLQWSDRANGLSDFLGM